ncbi:triose-phosphate transporter [Phlyctema vagabunda]|uniref:Triose-phosphate transporter n=1 Tax=Phlyctema vagabunda TaxID=108571 RepID=A0ABR4P730_9HELO
MMDEQRPTPSSRANAPDLRSATPSPRSSIIPSDHPPPSSSSSSRPSTKSPFPHPGLPRLPTVSDLLVARASNDEPDPAPDAVQAAESLNLHDQEMEPSQPSGHRRRRSSLMNNLEPGSKAKRTARSPSMLSRGIKEEEGKPSHSQQRGSDEDSKSTSEDLELEDLSEDDGLQDDEETGLTGRDRSKRKRRRRKNTQLDQRVAGDVKISAEEKKEADKNVVKNSIINGLLIVLWYLFSLSISIYNKWMFSPELLDFHFPLFTTCMHMLVQFALASLVLYCLPQLRPRYDSLSNPHNSQGTDSDQAQHEIDQKKPLMSRMFYFTRIGPCGIATGLDIGLGNMSLKFITLTFYTMCKSSSLAFVLLFAFLFRLETPSWRLVGIIGTMTVGVIMMVAGEVNFIPIGFILIISAAFFSGFRWALTQILLLRNPATSNPFSSIFYLAPIMFTTLFIIAVPVEGFPALWDGLGILVEKKGPILGPLLLLFPGTIAFCMTSAEFALLQRTSVVTLSIAGIFKEVVTILTAGIVFHDPLTKINISGLVVTIGAIVAYNWIKIRKMREDAQNEVHKSYAAQHHPSGTASGTGSGSDADGEDDDWDNEEAMFITADGDYLPKPDRVDGSSGAAADAPLLYPHGKKDNSD